MASCPVNAKGKLIPWRAIQSISFSHLSQFHQTYESVNKNIASDVNNANKSKFIQMITVLCYLIFILERGIQYDENDTLYRKHIV